jgi:dTDP-4-amino-4,6-dideoxygalactose transaminase
MPMITVPYLDLRLQHAQRQLEIATTIHDVITEGAFAGGVFVERFEKEFAEYCGVEHAIGVGSGSDALWLALMAIGVGPGDEVITVPMTFIATAEAISRTGARPIFVDIDAATYTLDPGRLEGAITSRTKAIIPVHLFGQMADMDPILEITKPRGIAVVEDAAQAHGASYKGSRAGCLGDIGCFSFYPGKNLGALGEAGAVVTRNKAFAEKVRLLRDHGQREKYNHSEVGWNCRMDGIQAAVLSLKLKSLDEWNDRRRQIAARYTNAFNGLPAIRLPFVGLERVHARHVFAVRVRNRLRFIRQLSAHGIGTSIHYPIPIHLQSAYKHLQMTKGCFPVSECCADEFVSLPIYPELSIEQIDHVINTVAGAAVPGLAA